LSREQSSGYPHLFAPLQRGRLRLKNRVVHLSMTTRYVVDGAVTDPLIRYFESRAAGGAALIVSEPVNATRFQSRPQYVHARDDAQLDGLKRWAEAVARHDCVFVGQLQDSGRGRHERGRNPNAFGVSALPDDLSWTVPHALTESDIATMIEDFAATARRLQDCGFAGVEISAGHGHLFHQFLSPWSNRRTDGYGGDFERRLRFVRELIAAIRANTRGDFLLGLKLPGDDGVPGSIDESLAGQIASALTAGDAVDYVGFCQGSHSRTLDWHVPDMHWPRGTWLSLSARLREHVNGLPLVAFGLLTDPSEGERVLAAGEAELVGLGRPLVTDPAWPKKAREGRQSDIRYCVSCNTCWGLISGPNRIACDNNPRVGMVDEVDWRPKPAARKRRIVVVGSGPAALEAAWTAGARGHDVTVLAAGGEPGGKTRLQALLPGGENLSSVYDYQYVEARRAGVRFEFGVRAATDDILALRPDAVVLGTGSTMLWPTAMPDAWRTDGFVPSLRDLVPELLGLKERQSGTAVLFDMDHTEGTYAAAELLHRLYDRVVLVTPRERIAGDVPLVTSLGTLRRLSRLGIDVVTLAEVGAASSLEDALVHCQNVYSGRGVDVRDVALLTYSTPRQADDALAAPLRAAGCEVHLVGDCYAPRTLLSATADGHRVGTEL
jgi:2,4-dienoyl-CoA reductase-like NADH-dependent reductase (Old Yellow Enzyme family)